MQSSSAEFRQQDKQHYLVSGPIVFATVPELLRSATTYFSKSDFSETVVVDLSQVTECNSAAIALMLELSRQVGDNRKQLRFKQLPESLITIAKAYGIEEQIREISE